ncbi:acyltransferase family protein [Streptosporangium sandarakinum]
MVSVATSSGQAGAPAERRPDLPALTGMRIIAALLVFLCHAVLPVTSGNHNPPMPYGDQGLTMNLLWFFSAGGQISLSFFFILSGFIITWSTRPGDRVLAYWRRRVVKIFPNHAVTWALAMILFAGAYTPYLGLPNLFLVNSFSPDPALWGGANMPAWSLGPEMFFYLLFPLLIIPIRKIAENRLWLWAVVTVAAMAALCLITVYVIPDSPTYPGEPQSLPQFWFSYMFPPARLVEFVLGMIVARLVISGRWPRIGVVPVVLFMMVGYAAALVAPAPFNQTLVSAVPFAVAIGSLAVTNIGGTRTVLGSRPMVWLGNISFAFYLTQSFILFYLLPKLFGQAGYGVVGGTALILGMIVANIVAGWALHTLVERPAMRWWSGSRRTRAPRGEVQEAPSAPAPVPAGAASSVGSASSAGSTD